MIKECQTEFRHTKEVHDVEAGVGDPGGVQGCCPSFQGWGLGKPRLT